MYSRSLQKHTTPYLGDAWSLSLMIGVINVIFHNAIAWDFILYPNTKLNFMRDGLLFGCQMRTKQEAFATRPAKCESEHGIFVVLSLFRASCLWRTCPGSEEDDEEDRKEEEDEQSTCVFMVMIISVYQSWTDAQLKQLRCQHC